MLQLVFTLDYEIHGNGDGCPLELMVEPTDRMLDLFDCYGAKLTIMAEVAEILRFREHAVTTGRDQFGYEAIVGQLRRAVASAHDVQLHLHPSYCRAVYRDGRWQQDYASYDLARLGQIKCAYQWRDVLAVGELFRTCQGVQQGRLRLQRQGGPT